MLKQAAAKTIKALEVIHAPDLLTQMQLPVAEESKHCSHVCLYVYMLEDLESEANVSFTLVI